MTPTFEITIQRCLEFDVFPVVAEFSKPGESLPQRTEGRLTLSAADVEELGTKTKAADYGRFIGELLFQGEVLRAFDRAVSGSSGRTNVLLAIEAPELRTLHWEWLCVPIDGTFRPIAQDQRFPFCLFQPSQVDRRFPPFGRRDLRMLIVCASPRGLEKYNLDPFDENRALESVAGAISGSISYDVLSCQEDLSKRVGAASLHKICERLTEKRYTLLHIIAHGRYARDGETVLYLGTDQGDVQPVPAKEFLARLAQLGTLPHFVFLAVCESARPEAEAALGGLGQRLVRELGTPAVLAMTRKVSHFLAYELARRLYPQLIAHGYVERALVEACAGLIGQADVSVPALYSRLGGRPLWSDDLVGRELTPVEIEYGLDRALSLFADRAPVLLPKLSLIVNKLRTLLGLPAHPIASITTLGSSGARGGKFRSTTRVMSGDVMGSTDSLSKVRLRSDTGLTDLATLGKDAKQEFQRALTEVETLCLQVLELGFTALALDKKVPVQSSQCPFPGMRAFAEDEQRYFFGREALVETLLRRIKAHPFLAVLGASGSGKSSVVRAGLLPSLKRDLAGIHCVTMTPGSDPYSHLDAALERVGVTESGRIDAGSIVLFVDQFEEVFTLCPREKRSLFLQRLLKLLPETKIVLTMRADFWGECAEHAELRQLMMEHQELVASMTPHELRSAIEQQARVAGLRFEPTLCAKIVEQVQSEPGAMPLLQHALLKLWERRHGTWLSSAEYESIGGVQRAIAETADSIYNELSEEERARMRTVFVRLTRVDDSVAAGETRRDTRQRVGKADLIPAGADGAAYLALIAHLADARLLVTSVSPSTQQEEVEVVHESLIRNWPRLQTWLEEQRDSLALREALSKAARDWKKRRRDGQWLIHSGSRLRECEELNARFPGLYNQIEQEYLTACRVQTKRTSLAWLAVLVGFCASGIGIFGLVHSQRVVQRHQGNQLVEAEQAAEVANSRQAGTLAMLLALEPGTRLRSLDQGILAVAPFLKQKTAPPGAALGGLHDGLVVATYVAPLIPAHAGSATAVALSPNGMLLVSAGADRQIRFFNSQDGTLHGSIRTTPSIANMLVFSHKGDRLYAAESDGTIRIYDPKARRLIRQLSSGSGSILSLALSRDETMLAAGRTDGTLELWNLTTGKRKGNKLVGHSGGVRTMAFSGEHDRLVSGGGDGTLRLWNLTGKRPKVQVIRAHQGAVNAVLVTPSGTAVISGGEDRQLNAWNLMDGTPEALRQSLNAPITALAMSGSERLAVGDSDGTTTLFRLGVRMPMGSLKDDAHDKPAAALTGIAFFSDPTRLVTATSDGLLRVWHLPRSPSIGYLPDHAAAITTMAWSHDGRYALTSAADRSLRILEMEQGRQVRELRDLDAPVIASEFSSATELTALTKKGTLLRYHIELDTVVSQRTLPVQRISAAQLAIGAHRALVASGNRVFLFALPHGELLREVQTPQTVHAVAISSDGKLAAIGSADERIRIYDLDGGAMLRTMEAAGGTTMLLRISADGRRLLSGGARQRARLWSLQSGLQQELPTNHSYKQVALGFSQDGDRVFVGSAHGIVTVHDTQTGQPLLFLRTRHGLLRTAILAPDGRKILTGGNDGSVHLLLIDVEQMWREGCDMLSSALRAEDDASSAFEQARAVCAAQRPSGPLGTEPMKRK